MAQGKLKVKTKLPQNVKNKKASNKGPAVSKRANRPIQPKKKKHEESHKLKQIVTKSLNKAVEEEMRSRAYDGAAKKLSKAQEAVAAYNSSASSSQQQQQQQQVKST